MTSADRSSVNRSVLTYHRIAEAFKFASAYRALLGDEDYANVSGVSLCPYMGSIDINSLISLKPHKTDVLFLNYLSFSFGLEMVLKVWCRIVYFIYCLYSLLFVFSICILYCLYSLLFVFSIVCILYCLYSLLFVFSSVCIPYCLYSLVFVFSSVCIL